MKENIYYFNKLTRLEFLKIYQTKFYQKYRDKLFYDFRKVNYLIYNNILFFYLEKDKILKFFRLNKEFDKSFNLNDIFENLDLEDVEIKELKIFSNKNDEIYNINFEVLNKNEIIFNIDLEKFLLTNKNPFKLKKDIEINDSLSDIFLNDIFVIKFPNLENSNIKLEKDEPILYNESILNKFRYDFKKEKKIAFEKLNEFLSKEFRYFDKYVNYGQNDLSKSLLLIDFTDSILSINSREFFKKYFNKEIKKDTILYLNFLLIDLVKLKKLLSIKEEKEIGIFDFCKINLDYSSYKINKIFSLNRSFILESISKESNLRYIKLVSDRFLNTYDISVNLVRGYKKLEGFAKDYSYILVESYDKNLLSDKLKIYKNPLYNLINQEKTVNFNNIYEEYFKFKIDRSLMLELLEYIENNEILEKAKYESVKLNSEFYVDSELVDNVEFEFSKYYLLKVISELVDINKITELEFYLLNPVYYNSKLNIEYEPAAEYIKDIVVDIKMKDGFIDSIKTLNEEKKISELFNVDSEPNIEHTLEKLSKKQNKEINFNNSELEEINESNDLNIKPDKTEKISLSDIESDLFNVFEDSDDEDDAAEDPSDLNNENNNEKIDINDLDSSDIIDQLVDFSSRKKDNFIKNNNVKI